VSVTGESWDARPATGNPVRKASSTSNGTPLGVSIMAAARHMISLLPGLSEVNDANFTDLPVCERKGRHRVRVDGVGVGGALWAGPIFRRWRHGPRRGSGGPPRLSINASTSRRIIERYGRRATNNNASDDDEPDTGPVVSVELRIVAR
jgi:hypothetical protein